MATPSRVSSCAERQRRVGRLGQEQRRQRHVDVGAVEVEAVAGRDHQARPCALPAPSRSSLAHHLRQRRLRRARRPARSAAPRGCRRRKLQDREAAERARSRPAPPARRAARSDRRSPTSAPRLTSDADAVLADGEGHGPEGADRRQPHDDADDAEEHLGRSSSSTSAIRRRTRPCGCRRSRSGWRSPAPAAGRPRRRRRRRCRGSGAADSRPRPRPCAPWRRSSATTLGSSVAGSMLKPCPGCTHLADDQADDQRQGRDHLEIDQRLARRARPKAFRSPIAAMPAPRCRRSPARSTILISLMKASPSGFRAAPVSGRSSRPSDAEHDGDQHLDVENGIPRAALHGVFNRASLQRESGRTEPAGRTIRLELATDLQTSQRLLGMLGKRRLCASAVHARRSSCMDGWDSVSQRNRKLPAPPQLEGGDAQFNRPQASRGE